MKTDNEEYLDDITFIKDMKHSANGPFHQYDVLLDAQKYGWDYMIDTADYLAGADLRSVTEVRTGDLGSQGMDITGSYHEHGDKFRDTPQLKVERGFLSVAGDSAAIEAPVKVMWVNQTRAMRLYTLKEDEMLVRKYIETLIRRSFGSDDAMKLGKNAAEQESGFDVKTSLFLIPVSFEGEEAFPDEPDKELHFGIRESQMAQIGSKLACSDLPEDFVPAKAARSGMMHYHTLAAPDGKKFMPLFTSYTQMTAIFGISIRTGVICYETAKEFVLKENLSGIVISPGSRNTIISAEDLIKSNKSGKSETYTEIFDQNKEVDYLKQIIGIEPQAASVIAECILRIDLRLRNFLKRWYSDDSDRESFAEEFAEKISNVLEELDTEVYVDLINELACDLKNRSESDMTCSAVPSLIDDYELRMKDVLREQAKVLRSNAVKREFRLISLSFSTEWVDGFLRIVEDWLRYSYPLIRLAAARGTENDYVNESIECLQGLLKSAFKNYSRAEYKLAKAFDGYFSDIPSARAWLKWHLAHEDRGWKI